MSTKQTSKNYLQFGIVVAIVAAVGYALSLGANMLYEAGLKNFQLPLGDSTLILGGLYFTIVAVGGMVIAYFYERFRCV